MSKLRCDNGGEFLSSNLRNWCKQKGMILDYAAPYSPQLNGKAERMNKTIMERARSLIIDSNLDKSMWGEAILTSVFIINRCQTSVVDTTPFIHK